MSVTPKEEWGYIWMCFKETIQILFSKTPKTKMDLKFPDGRSNFPR